MKKICLLVFITLFFSLLFSVPGTFTQRRTFGTNVPDVTEILTFNKLDTSTISGFNSISSITLQTSITVSDGYYSVDNDSPSVASVDIILGVTANYPGSQADNNDLGVTTFPSIVDTNKVSYTLDPTTGDATNAYNQTNSGDYARYDGETKTVSSMELVGSIYHPTYLGIGTYSVALNEVQTSGHSGASGVYYSGGPVSSEGWVEIIITYDHTVPVELSTFTALFMDGTPTLQWITQSESNNMGWNVYRSDNDSFDTSMQINYDIIPGAGTTAQPTNYEFMDEYPAVQGYTYYYWVESVDLDGTTEQHGPASLEVPTDNNNQQSPDFTKMDKFYNYPNPMNPDTWIYFETETPGEGNLTIYNIRGEKVNTIHKGNIIEGVNKFYWDGKNNNGDGVKSGVYLYVLKVGSRTLTQKMVLVK